MTQRLQLLPPELDLQIVSAEDAAYEFYGLGRTGKQITIRTSAGEVDVRVSVFGDATNYNPVLLLHGIGSAQVLAAPLMTFLGGRQVVALDWPGHGLSGPCVLAPTHDMRSHASSVVEAVLDALDLPVVDLVGHSMGAQFSLYAGLDLGARIRRLVLLGAPGAAFQGIRPLTAMKLLAMPRLGPFLLSRPVSDRAFDRFNELALGPGALDRHGPVRTALQLLGSRTTNSRSLASFFCAMVKAGQVREGVALTERDLGRIAQPTFLAWGDEDVFLHPLEAARSIVAVRDSHLLRVRAAGHAPWLQAQDLVGRSVAEHLNS
ncbi:alpha/beta hydrolase [Nocardioides immobilis]|uniref:Alpha/beta hydrolase n=1 Tax=Nocardioides immobilis TaxID=2049295 RepID=A0A417Y6X9_9ACTN|nr:alpha/beta hydrolase [Nocardioides immobilis]RHW28502.1 alpha/beta hydrolase [Nocardioides immobilis]